MVDDRIINKQRVLLYFFLFEIEYCVFFLKRHRVSDSVFRTGVSDRELLAGVCGRASKVRVDSRT